jgi:hypothetical protein
LPLLAGSGKMGVTMISIHSKIVVICIRLGK